MCPKPGPSPQPPGLFSYPVTGGRAGRTRVFDVFRALVAVLRSGPLITTLGSAGSSRGGGGHGETGAVRRGLVTSRPAAAALAEWALALYVAADEECSGGLSVGGPRSKIPQPSRAKIRGSSTHRPAMIRPQAPTKFQTGPYLSTQTNAGLTKPARKCPRRTSTVGAHDHPQGTDKDRRPTRVSAGQAPYDLARPKGFEPPTF